MQLYCFEFFIQIESLFVNVRKYMGPSKKDHIFEKDINLTLLPTAIGK